MPTAWVENTGNDLAILSIDVTGLPEGWTANHPESLIISPNQVIGLPISLLPDPSWDSTPISVTIEVIHPIIGLQTISIPVEASSFAFTSSPVISGVVGDTASVSVTNNDVDLPSNVQLSSSTLLVSIPNGKQNLTLTSSDGVTEYYIHSAGYLLPEYSASCSFISAAMDELGIKTINDKIGTCTLVATSDDSFSGTVVLLTNDGNNVALEQNQFSVSKGGSLSLDINTTNWKPDAGELTVTLIVIDSFGRQITERSTEVISRASGWNIGIQEITAEQDIRISIIRTSYERLAGVTCLISLDSPDNDWSETIIIDINGFDFAPIIEIDDPGVFDNDDLIRAELKCASPYDIDDVLDDDTAQVYYKSAKSEIIDSSQMIYGIMTTIIVIAIAYFAGLLTPNATRKQRPQKTNQNKEPVVETEQSEDIQETPEQELDDFSIEIEEDGLEKEVIEIQEEEDIEDSQTNLIDESSASGRLASLRDEMMSDDKPVDSRPITDRMADFFKD
ncbi:MAG TPA: hypothetical protein D7I03_05345 [Candidatus Poseidoniales archaeon]|nr:MAG TPA: hypothetical protein D7I03_05345 [Candidatus Poseidoniales archaeon]